jgi:hypothetical protein
MKKRVFFAACLTFVFTIIVGKGSTSISKGNKTHSTGWVKLERKQILFTTVS